MLNGWDGVIGVQVSFFVFLQTWRFKLMPKSSILVSSDHSTFSQPSSESSRCLFANFRWACTCTFLSRRTLRALYDFSALQHNGLLMVILVTVVPAALRSSISSCCVVLGCSFTFLLIRFTTHWEILQGASVWERLLVNWYFFHFLIAPTACQSSCSPLQSCVGIQFCSRCP